MLADITCQSCPSSSSRPHVNRLALPQLIRAHGSRSAKSMWKTFKTPQLHEFAENFVSESNWLAGTTLIDISCQLFLIQAVFLHHPSSKEQQYTSQSVKSQNCQFLCYHVPPSFGLSQTRQPLLSSFCPRRTTHVANNSFLVTLFCAQLLNNDHVIDNGAESIICSFPDGSSQTWPYPSKVPHPQLLR